MMSLAALGGTDYHGACINREIIMKNTIRFSVNGRPTTVQVDEDRVLLWVLRTELGLTGTKYGCGEGLCGSCTVLVEGEAVHSCQHPMKKVARKDVMTIEGLANNGDLHPLQTAFVEHDALQCGFCTPGMVLRAYSLLLSNPEPTRQEVIDHMENNLCRCGAHTRILRAIQTAADEMAEGVRS
jgi:aerobic-type carbon monoxide dehydrogenase small subunit (CoxS/CutS family)